MGIRACRMAVLCAFISVAPLAATGCYPPEVSSASLRASGRVAVAAPISASLEYRKVVALYDRGDYNAAVRLIDQILASPNVATDHDRQFLIRQRSICLQATQRPVASPSPTIVTQPSATSPGSSDCGPRALLLVCESMRKPIALSDLTRAAGTGAQGTSMAGLQRAAEAAGLSARGVQMDRDALANLASPAVAWVDGNHFVAVLHVTGNMATIHDPNKKRKENIKLSDLIGRSGGILLVVEHRQQSTST